MLRTSFVAFLTIFTTQLSANAQPASFACSAQEEWPNLDAPYKEPYRLSIRGKTSPVLSLSQAIEMKQWSNFEKNGEFLASFSEYWLARILFDLKLDLLAAQAFEKLYRQTSVEPLKIAALACLAEIEKRTPDLKVPSHLTRAEVPDALFLSLKQNLGPSFSEPLAKQLPAAYQNLLFGIHFSAVKKYSNAIPYLEQFIAHPESLNDLLSTFVDQAKLLLAHAYFSTQNYAASIQQFNQISKTSNLEMDALSDLTWAYLENKQPNEVMGIALQLRMGNFKNAFTPESLMVAAIALHEECLYPESLKFLSAFKQDYVSSDEWLKKNKDFKDPYQATVEALQLGQRPKQKSRAALGIPKKIISEWIKNPSFISHQLELNALAGQQALTTTVTTQAQHEFDQAKSMLLLDLEKFPLHGNEVPPELFETFHQLKHRVRALDHFQRALQIWDRLSQRNTLLVSSARTKWRDQINVDLVALNQSLMNELERIAENAALIEIEVLHSASHDLIWKNAHPELALALKQKSDSQPSRDHVWNWGKIKSSDLEHSEVWDDELGALKADLSQACHSKKGAS